jgi:hypothetical protein
METMESTGTKQAREKIVNPDAVNVAVSSSAALSASPKPVRSLSGSAASASAPNVAMEHKLIGYGLPCANCRAYYPSDMNACPICKSQERVSPASVGQIPTVAAAPQSDEAKLLSEERERLRDLKAQIYSQAPATTFRCALDQKHNGTVEPAAICHSCYGEVRQQADRMEAALHIDSKEAAKIVYDAVWADTSDPNKTYLNAAAALLSELRKRAGIGLLLGANQPLAH